MNIEEFITENKKLISRSLIIYILIMIAIIYFIWRPESSADEAILWSYEEYDEKEVQQRVMDNYMQDIAYKVMLSQEDQIAEIISQNYLDYSQKTPKDVIKGLKQEGYLGSYNVQIKNVVQYDLGDVQVYAGDLTNGGASKNINVIETYPNEYKISFDDFYKYTSYSNTYEENGVKFSITAMSQKLKQCSYDITISNIDNEYTSFNLLSNSGIVLVLNDGTEFNISDGASYGTEYTKIDKGSSIRIKPTFKISLNLQDDIAKIVFKDVRIDGSEADIEVKM